MDIKHHPPAAEGRHHPACPPKARPTALIIAAALARRRQPYLQSGRLRSDTSPATLGCMEALGAGATSVDDATLQIAGNAGISAPAGQVLDCGESGSTLRFLIPIALALTGDVTFRRPRQADAAASGPLILRLFQEKGICYITWRADVLTVRGALTPGQYALRGNVSSQFITGLLYALPLLHGDSGHCAHHASWSRKAM